MVFQAPAAARTARVSLASTMQRENVSCRSFPLLSNLAGSYHCERRKSKVFWRECRRSAILTPLNCPGILSPSRNEGDNHVEPGRAEALVRREPSHGRQVDCEKSGGVVETQCAASPALDSGIPAARSCRGGAWESGTASGKPNSPKNGESDREISLRNVLGIQSTTLQRDADGA